MYSKATQTTGTSTDESGEGHDGKLHESIHSESSLAMKAKNRGEDDKGKKSEETGTDGNPNEPPPGIYLYRIYL